MAGPRKSRTNPGNDSRAAGAGGNGGHPARRRPATATSAPADTASPAHPQPQGTWTLNEDLTARMRETDQQHGDKRGAGGGFGHRGGGGRRGGGSGQAESR